MLSRTTAIQEPSFRVSGPSSTTSKVKSSSYLLHHRLARQTESRTAHPQCILQHPTNVQHPPFSQSPPSRTTNLSATALPTSQCAPGTTAKTAAIWVFCACTILLCHCGKNSLREVHSCDVRKSFANSSRFIFILRILNRLGWIGLYF